MRELEAIAQGLRYTGISWDGWNRKKCEEAKSRVAAIKAKYKVRAVIVDHGNGWRSYYGDDNFRLVQYDDAEKVQARVDAMPAVYERLRKEYNQRVADEKEYEEAQRVLLAKIKAITK